MKTSISAFRRFLRIASLAFLLLTCSTVALAQRPDMFPDLGLLRPDGAGGTTSGVVHALASQPDGKLLVAGEFTQTRDGVVRTHLLRLNGNGSLDPTFSVSITSGSRAVVRAIAVDADGIFIGGAFTHVGGQPRNGVAKIGFDGQVADWSPALGSGNDVFALAVDATHVYVGGDVTTADAFGLARLERASGDFDLDFYVPTQIFTATTPSAGNRGRVTALLRTDTDLIVGGYFRQIAGVERKSVARVSVTTPVVVGAYNPPISSGALDVAAFALDAESNALYVGGEFYSSGSQNHLVRTNATTGALDVSWIPQPAGKVYALALAGRQLYVGGNFLSATQQHLMRVAVASPGAIDASWQPLPDAMVRSLLYERGALRLHVGGAFVYADVDARNGLARYSMAGAQLLFRDGLEAGQ